MQRPPIQDGQSMFDVSLQAASGRMAELRGDTKTPGVSVTARVPGRPGLRYALGVRLLALGAALVADEPLVAPRRPLARG